LILGTAYVAKWFRLPPSAAAPLWGVL